MSQTWREVARPIIAKVIKEHGTDDMKQLRKVLRAAYPFGVYAYHPCKIWRDEIRVQLGKKKQRQRKVEQPAEHAAYEPLEGQMNLFDMEG